MSLVLGAPGSGKSTLGKQFLYEALTKRRQAILLDTHETFSLAKETMASFEWDSILIDSIIFVDCYSWRTRGAGAKYSGSPQDLTSLSITLSDLLNKERIEPSSRARMVIDSFSDAVAHAGADPAAKFLELLKARLGERKVTSLVMLEEGLHEAKANAAIEYITDGTIRMRFEEVGRSLMASRMVATPVTLKWIPFTLARGIELEATNFFR